MAVHVLITFKAKPEMRSGFAELLSQVRRDLPQTPGCREVRVFENSADSCTFVVLETWESQAQHRAQLDRIVSSGVWDHVRSFLACEPTSGYHVELS